MSMYWPTLSRLPKNSEISSSRGAGLAREPEIHEHGIAKPMAWPMFLPPGLAALVRRHRNPGAGLGPEGQSRNDSRVFPQPVGDRKSFVSAPASAGRRVVLVAWWALAIALMPFTFAPAAAQVTLEVAAFHGLPGLHHSALSRFIASHMAEARLANWRFEPSTGDGLAADRVEWSFTLHPYAGGEVRRFAHSLSGQPRPGTRRPVTIEARLYLHGEYQMLVEEQATIQGGPDDPDLAEAVVKATQNLLGPQGAYRAIDTRQPQAHREK